MSKSQKLNTPLLAQPSKIALWKLPAPPDALDERTKRLNRVAIRARPEDCWCVWLAIFGQNYKVIQSATGLSPGKIGYRLRKKARISPRDFRNGSALARLVIEWAAKELSDQVFADL